MHTFGFGKYISIPPEELTYYICITIPTSHLLLSMKLKIRGQLGERKVSQRRQGSLLLLARVVKPKISGPMPEQTSFPKILL